MGVQKYGNTLEILNLRSFNQVVPNLQKVLENCKKLKELNIGGSFERINADDILRCLAENLTSRIEKLDFSCNIWNIFEDSSVKWNAQTFSTFTSRCNNIKTLVMTGVTDDTLTIIMDTLKNSLEELDMDYSDVTSDKLLELKSMHMLKVLIYNKNIHWPNEIETFLKVNLPHISINKKLGYSLKL